MTLRVTIEDGRRVIRVIDAGPGIDDGSLPRIFDPLEQGEAPVDPHPSGDRVRALARADVGARDGRRRHPGATGPDGSTFTWLVALGDLSSSIT